MTKRADMKGPKPLSVRDSDTIVLDRTVEVFRVKKRWLTASGPKTMWISRATSKRSKMDVVGLVKKGRPTKKDVDSRHISFRFPGLVVKTGAKMADDLRSATRLGVRYGQDERTEVIDLKAEIGEGVLDSVLTEATKVFGDSDYAARWLQAPIRSLGGTPPLLLMRSSAGVARVRETLGKIEYGLF